MSVEQISTDGLRVSRLDWRRLRRLVMYGSILSIGVCSSVLYFWGGVDAFILNADGYVTRDNVAIAPPFEGQVVEVLVRPGDKVQKGQRIAIVQSIALKRTLSELAAEKARLSSRIAELETRNKV